MSRFRSGEVARTVSAGDQLLRRDMSEPQHEQLSALLDTIYEGFTGAVAASRGKSVAEVPYTNHSLAHASFRMAECNSLLPDINSGLSRTAYF